MKTNKFFLTLAIATLTYGSFLQADNLAKSWATLTQNTPVHDATCDEYDGKVRDIRDGFRFTCANHNIWNNRAEGLKKFRKTNEFKRSSNGPLRSHVASYAAKVNATKASIYAHKRSIEQYIRQIENLIEKVKTRIANDNPQQAKEYREITDKMRIESEKLMAKEMSKKEKETKRKHKKTE